jgi:hypothetical protein
LPYNRDYDWHAISMRRQLARSGLVSFLPARSIRYIRVREGVPVLLVIVPVTLGMILTFK